MRFARTDVKNVSMRGGLRFDTEYDNHGFSIGFHRKKLLREAFMGKWLQPLNPNHYITSFLTFRLLHLLIYARST